MTPALPDRSATLDTDVLLKHAVALAEKYGEAILKISAALEDGTPGGIKRAQAIIAGLGPKDRD